MGSRPFNSLYAAAFCENHAPNGARQYNGCVVCSRNEESAQIEEVIKSFGWAHDEEAEMNLGGSQWYCIGDEERGTWGTSDALNKALEDYDSLREACKKARLWAAKEQARAELAESRCSELREMLRTCGYHTGGCNVFDGNNKKTWRGRDEYLADERCDCGLRRVLSPIPDGGKK